MTIGTYTYKINGDTLDSSEILDLGYDPEGILNTSNWYAECDPRAQNALYWNYPTNRYAECIWALVDDGAGRRWFAVEQTARGAQTMTSIVTQIKTLINSSRDEDIARAIIRHHGGAEDLASRMSFFVDLDSDSSEEEIGDLVDSFVGPCARNEGYAAMMAALDRIADSVGSVVTERPAYANNCEEWTVVKDGEGVALWWDDAAGVESAGWLVSKVIPGWAGEGGSHYCEPDACENVGQLLDLARRVFKHAL